MITFLLLIALTLVAFTGLAFGEDLDDALTYGASSGLPVVLPTKVLALVALPSVFVLGLVLVVFRKLEVEVHRKTMKDFIRVIRS